MGQGREAQQIPIPEIPVPDTDLPAEMPPMDEAALEDKLRLDEASREAPPPAERVIEDGVVVEPEETVAG